MKRWLFLIAALVFLLFGCLPKGVPYYRIASNIPDSGVVAPKSVIVVSLRDDKGNLVPSSLEVVKDGTTFLEKADAESHVFAVEDEGVYEIVLKPVDSSLELELKFKVLNFEREIYEDGGTYYIDEIPTSLTDAATDIMIRFYKYASEVLETTTGEDEEIDKRVRLNLVDTDGDGIYDKWEEVETKDEHEWIQLQHSFNYSNTEWRIWTLVYSEDKIVVRYYGVSGDYEGYYIPSTLAVVGFDLNLPYARYMETYDGSANVYGMFKLHERYDSSTKPEFYLTSSATQVSPGDEVVVKVKAPNVARFAELYDVRYMQLTIKFSEKLALKDVQFHNFMKYLKDMCAYKESSVGTSVALYRGFVMGEDETEEPTDTFATLVFDVSEEATTGNSLAVSIVYEPWWTTYGLYPDVPNPVFRNVENACVDGFVVDGAPLTFSVGGGE